MDQYAQRITRDYPVRRKAQEKENMRTYLMGQLRALGYDAKLNDCGKAVNVIAGDPERASILYAAHYDTPLREPLPAILCPTRPVTYMLYQALTPVLALVLCFAVSLGVTFALSLPNLTLPLFLVLLVGALAYLKYGPSEKNNVNANTSGGAAPHRRAAHAALPQRRLLPLSGRRQRQYAGRQGLPQALSERQGEARPLPRLRGQRGRAADPAGHGRPLERRAARRDQFEL